MNKALIIVNLAGAAGAATGVAETPTILQGKVYAVHLEFSAQPATTDVLLRMANSPNEPILNLTNVNTNGWYYPRKGVMLNDGTALYYNTSASAWQTVAEPYVCYDYLLLSVTQGDPVAAGVRATVYLID